MENINDGIYDCINGCKLLKKAKKLYFLTNLIGIYSFLQHENEKFDEFCDFL